MDIDLQEHQGLAYIICKRYKWALGPGLCPEDLMQAANIGLVKAAKKFDPSYGNKFSTYAVWWIRAEVNKEVCRNVDTITLGVRMRQERRDRGMSAKLSITSLDAPVLGGEDSTYMDFLADDFVDTADLMGENGVSDEVQKALMRLQPRVRDILRALYWAGESLSEIGRRHGVSRERIRQLKNKGMEQMKQYLSSSSSLSDLRSYSSEPPQSA